MPEKSAEDDKSADATRRDRLDALLGAIEDEMRGCLELSKDGNRADDERILLLEGDRVREAARYLRDVGLEPSAIELMNRYSCYFDAVSELAYCAIFRSFPSSERDLNHTRLGLPEPERSDAEHAEQQQTRRIRATGHAAQLLDFVVKLRDVTRSDGSDPVFIELSDLSDPIPVVELTKCLGHQAGRSDKLADKMRRKQYPLVKSAGRWHCQRADALAMFPRFASRIKNI